MPSCRTPSYVQEVSPLLWFEVEIQVPEGSEPANGEPESCGQPGGRPAVDQESGAVLRGGGSVVGGVVPIGAPAHPDRANPAASTAAPDVVSDDAWG